MVERVWTWRQLVKDSDLPSYSKHLLLTLSIYMNEVGGSCFPTKKQLAKDTGLADSTVRKYLEIAAQHGFVKISKHGFGGQRWANDEYHALWPEGAPCDNTPSEKGAPSDVKGAPSGGGKVRRQAATNSSYNTPTTLHTPPAPPSGGNPPKKKAQRKKQIPDHFPSHDDMSKEMEKHNFTRKEIEDEADKFRDHHEARGTVFANWGAGWRTWCRNAKRFSGQSRGTAVGNYRPGQSHSRPTTMAGQISLIREEYERRVENQQ